LCSRALWALAPKVVRCVAFPHKATRRAVLDVARRYENLVRLARREGSARGLGRRKAGAVGRPSSTSTARRRRPFPRSTASPRRRRRGATSWCDSSGTSTWVSCARRAPSHRGGASESSGHTSPSASSSSR
jgi:hypothetical protein